MLEEFKKSIQSTLYERLSSPLSGAFLFSWLAWNWKFVYYFFYTENGVTFENKLIFIRNNFIGWNVNLINPGITAIFFVAIYPLFNTGALWVWLKYKKWQQDIKNQIEKNQLLTLEQSIELRYEIRNQQKLFEELLTSKNIEIENLKSELNRFSDNQTKESSNVALSSSSDLPMFEKIINDGTMKPYIGRIIDGIQKGASFSASDIPPSMFSFFEANNIIEKPDLRRQVYKFTEKGKEFLKYYFEKM